MIVLTAAHGTRKGPCMHTRLVTLALICTTIKAGVCMAQQHPNVFINAAEIAAVRARVGANQQPWKRAYDEMIADANAALNQAPKGVTSQGSTSHDYYTQQPYDWSNNMPSPCGATHCDGLINPLADRADYEAAEDVCRAIRDLGMAYACTDDTRYADKAIVLVNAWCLDAATYMTPHYTNGQSEIELSVTIPGMFYGADLMYGYAGWAAAQKAAFLQWAADFTQSATSWSRTNNFENWRLVVLAAGAALTDNQQLLDRACARWREIIPSQVAADGHLTQETSRTKSLDYSTYALNAMLQTAEIARHRGVDLYHYTTSGRGLELVLDYHAPFIVNTSAWPYEQIAAYTGANTAVFECACSMWGKQSYLDVINRWGRPMYENRIMGYTTLTHAGGFVVAPDEDPPEIESVSAAVDSTKVRVVFSEMVEQSSATNTSHYAVSPGVAVSNAQLSPDGKVVTLTVSPLQEAVNYTLTVSNVSDRASPANTLTSQQVGFEFLGGLFDDFEEGGRLEWTPKTPSRWQIDTDSGDHSYRINTTDFLNDGDMLGEYSLLAGHVFGDFTMAVSVRSDELSSNSAADAAVVFGYQNATNYYYVMLNVAAQWTQVFQVVNGVRTALATSSVPGLALDRYTTVVLTLESQALRVEVGGSTVMTASLQTAGHGAVGLGSYNDAALFDDFSIASASGSAVNALPRGVLPLAACGRASAPRSFDLGGRLIRATCGNSGRCRKACRIVADSRGKRTVDTSRVPPSSATHTNAAARGLP